MAQELRLALLGDASDLEKAFSNAASSAEMMEGSLTDLQGQLQTAEEGQVAFNQTAGRYVNEAGQFISAAEGQERALQELSDIGVTTRKEFEEQIANLERLKGTVEEGSVEFRQLANMQQRVERELESLAGSQSQVQQELRETAAAQQRVESTGVTMRSSVHASANNLGFELVQASQDATHSLGAVANQIPLISEQFTQLSAKTGSTTAALRALGGSIFGTAGIIGAITLGLPLLSEMASGLGDVSEKADEAKESFEGLLASTRRLNQQLIPTGDQLEQITSSLSGLSEPLTGVEGLAESLQGGLLAGPGTQEAQLPVSRQAESLQRFAERLTGSSEQARLLRDALASAGVRVEDITRAAEVSQQALVQSAQRGSGAFTQARQAIISSKDALIAFAEDPLQAIEKEEAAARALRRELERINDRIQKEGALPGLIKGETEAAKKRLSELENAVRRVMRAPDLDIDAEEFEFLRKRLAEAGGELERLKENTEDTSKEAEELARAQRRITRAVEDEVIAREEAKTLLEDLGTSNDQVARSVAETLGTVEDLRATLEDLSGPQGQILARQQQTKQELKQQVELQKQLNRLQQEALPEGFQTDSPGANLFLQQQSEEFARNLQASAKAIDQVASQMQLQAQFLPDPGRIQAANLSLQEMQNVMQEIVDEFGVGALNVNEFLSKVDEVGERLQEFGVADTRLQAIRTEINAVKRSLANLAKQGVDPSSQAVQDLKDKLESLQRQAVGLRVAQQAGVQLATAGFNQLGRAIAGADDAMEKFKQTFASTLQTIGQGLLQSAIAGPLGLGFGALGGVFTLAGGAVSGALGLAEGGKVLGEGGTTEDRIPAMLSDKEYVVQAASAQMAPEALQAINEDPAFAGMIEQFVTARDVEQFASGGMVGGSTSSATARAVFSAIEPEEFVGSETGATSDGVPSSTVQAERELKAAPPKRELSIQLETEMKRINRRELALMVRGANEIRDQYGYSG